MYLKGLQQYCPERKLLGLKISRNGNFQPKVLAYLGKRRKKGTSLFPGEWEMVVKKRATAFFGAITRQLAFSVSYKKLSVPFLQRKPNNARIIPDNIGTTVSFFRILGIVIRQRAQFQRILYESAQAGRT